MKKNIAENESVLGWILSTPSVVWILLIIVYPVILTLWISLHQQKMVEVNPPFIGLKNYIDLLPSAKFLFQLKLTVIWTFLNIVLITPVGVLLGLLLNRQFKGVGILRTWILLSWIIPIVATTLIWQWMLEPTVGIINFLLYETGITRSYVNFLGDPSISMLSIVVVNVWRWSPFMGIMTLAALQNVPKEFYDAARVDGANAWQTFWHITLPQIIPTVSVTSFILIIWLFNMFPPIWLLTEGGPIESTTTLPIAIYKEAFRLFRMGKAATYSIILLIVVSAFVAGYMMLFVKSREEVVK